MSTSDSEAVDQNVGDLAKDGSMVSGYSFSRNLPPDPVAINAESWAAAEVAVQQVVNCVHPTLDSEKKRKEVIDYVRRLFNRILDSKVFPYGSVPLKTYLPHGDIDLTTFRSPNIEGSLAHEVLALLRREEQSENAEYEVKDTELIDAEVKIVKCFIEGISIDISFNQFGGLHALCFLEQVNCLVGKNHLFKRSIILVKAWCYYESRILGADHGLISTYALETLVLYIFHLFHSSLNSPLEVLYGFLTYFGQFDWDTYCVSLQGPVCISSLPDIVVEMPENGQKNRMLSEEFLKNCKELFSNSSQSLETKPKAFPIKHLNIIDPLKENNNLGHSVNRGNFYRIRSAFKYGAKKLGQVLSRPRDKVADEVSGFFRNILGWRHGDFALAELTGDYDSHIRCLQYAQQCQEFALSTPLSNPAADSALPASTFGSEGPIQSPRRNTGFLDMNRRNELAPTSRGSNASTREVMHAQSRIRGRRSQARSLSPRSVGEYNHANVFSSSYRIQFGTIGDPAEDVADTSLSLGFSQEAQDSRAVPKKER